jgi:hypothetical protein
MHSRTGSASQAVPGDARGIGPTLAGWADPPDDQPKLVVRENDTGGVVCDHTASVV